MEEKERQEIVDLGQTNSEMTDNTDDIIAAAERRIANLQKVISLALRITNQTDWVDFQGKPYLGSSGSQKVARLFGVCWREMKTEKIISSDEKGQFYFYKTVALFYLKGKNDLVEATGTCSSKDKFFGTIHGATKPMSEIDETNILKSSVTNCISNGITSLLGLKNLTWEQVKSSGIIQNITARVDYAAGGAGGGLISLPQANRLYAIAKTAGWKDEDMKAEMLVIWGYASSKEIKKEQYEEICIFFGKKPSGIKLGE